MCFQVPDVKSGNDRVDAVLVDEESVGTINQRGSGAKILRGHGALYRYLTENERKNSTVSLYEINFRNQKLRFQHYLDDLEYEISLR